MNDRRRFMQRAAGVVLAAGGWLRPIRALAGSALAGTSVRVLPEGTDPSSLKDLNPEALDTGRLEVMPLDAFRTMGDTEMGIDPQHWTLRVGGQVHSPAEFSYSRLLSLPVVERNVLLVCPGVFSNHGRWKGVSGSALMDAVGVSPEAGIVIVHGRSHTGDHKAIFPIGAFESDRVFLCYQVNGEPLPEKHGFPLRVVAEGHFGSEWAKYVYRIEFVKTDDNPRDQEVNAGA